MLAGTARKVAKSQERKTSPKRKFLGRTSRGHPGVIRADIPAQNFGQGGQNPGEKQAFRCGHPRPVRRGRPFAGCFLFPLRGPGKPPGRKSPKNGEKLQNSPPRSDPQKWGKITEKLQKAYFRSNFSPFWANFPHFRGSDRGGEFCNFFPIFRGFPPRRLSEPSKGENNPQP